VIIIIITALYLSLRRFFQFSQNGGVRARLHELRLNGSAHHALSALGLLNAQRVEARGEARDLALQRFDLVIDVSVVVGRESECLGLGVFLGLRRGIQCGRAQVFFGALGGRPRSLHREEGVAAVVVEGGVVPHLNVVHGYCCCRFGRFRCRFGHCCCVL